MKTPKSVVDNTAAYMDKGATNRNSQNEPKGVDYATAETHKDPDVSLGMQQHRKTMNKFGNRHGGPLEHFEPNHKIFGKL